MNRRRLVYLIGEPGAGKSTLLGAALAGCEREAVARPVAHMLLRTGGQLFGCELGAMRASFPGTDALPMNAITGAEQLLADPPVDLVIGEGARLGCARFFETAVRLNYFVELVHVISAEAAAHRAARTPQQNPSWVKGQITRVDNLIKRPPAGLKVYCVDAMEPHAVSLMRQILELPERAAA